MTWLLSLFILLYSPPVVITPDTREVELKVTDLDLWEDVKGDASIAQVSDPDFQPRFNKDLNFIPQDYNTSSAYWVKLKVIIPDVPKGYLLEFFDQTIDSLDVYIQSPEAEGFDRYQMGDMFPFTEKPFAHKNFEIQLPRDGEYLIYFRVKSHEYADIRVAIRSYSWFMEYALAEYYLYGIFYGMILIISLYNLLIYSAIREIKYLYYTFYMISGGAFAMSVDGVGFQYIWRESPMFNQVAHGISLFLMIFWAILFSKKFLNLKIRAPKIDKVLNVVFAARIGVFIYALFINNDLFQYRNIELVPLTIIFWGSIMVYRRGYQPARFFIVAFGFLFLGFILKALLMLSVIPFYILSYYSLHICFVFEMLFLSFALSDRVRILKANRDRALRRIISQHEETARLKDGINARLEQEVALRTNELREKNELLEQQKRDISQINSLLDLDNYRLRNNIKSIQRERIQNKELTYEEFKEVFGSREECLKALSNFKWRDGYACFKCGASTHSKGSSPMSRRCTKCGYQESPTTHTLFHGIRFPLEKAFYILYETTNKDQYSLNELSEILDLRKNTVWEFKKRIKSQSDNQSPDIHEIFNDISSQVEV
ncbi:7TM diverse intracellular signaling domain-containing protein [Marinoscillum furvescens]|uniref:7TMR-DISM extracellular protein 2 n=1 Tax=Marinoscillum furvescens DSM 4134 TaxID=1122208 RepID=A0A3D9L0A8_MARFU|nr:7TM diverse intracellular signaling domain-containing protein [Marinoscillum furvescens]RED96174.1 7TMR-DISM extracellular protein 2 [Marinoscillum furvescens DSM 4134]